MIDPATDMARWPLELARLQSAILAAGDDAARDAARGEVWRLLFQALTRFLRFHSRTARGADPAVLEDIAADKALDLLLRAESGAWDLAGRTAGEIAGYVSRTARFGWIDHAQRASRFTAEAEGLERGAPGHLSTSRESAADRAEAREFTAALRGCVEALPARGRRVWFFRAYYEMNSRDIAAHPLVGVNAAHVDVLVQRARGALRDCLLAKGHVLEGEPSTAFIDLWDLLDSMVDSLVDALADSPATQECVDSPQAASPPCEGGLTS